MKLPLPGILKNQHRLAGALLLSLCVAAYSKSSATMDQTAVVEACDRDNPGEALKKTVEISAGGPYVAKAGVPITLHGKYSVAGQTANSEQLKVIGQAIQSYAHDYGTYPPAALMNARGQRTVSWRVLLLPYLEQKDLYDRFDLTKPWDSRANLHLLSEMPAVYRKSGADDYATETGFAGVQGLASLFQNASEQLSGGRPLKGTSAAEEIAVAPVGEEVHLPWTAPGDVDIANVTQLGSPHGFSGEGHAITPLLFLDGTVYLMPDNVGSASMSAWTHFSKIVKCTCAMPGSVDADLRALWDLGKNGDSNTQGWDATFLAWQPGKYTVALHAFDHFNNQYETSVTVSVR